VAKGRKKNLRLPCKKYKKQGDLPDSKGEEESPTPESNKIGGG